MIMDQEKMKKNLQKALNSQSQESHNEVFQTESIAALVRLLARIEAEKDFKLYLETLSPSHETTTSR